MYRRAMLPILALLRMGATPQSLAWSIAAGVLIGINPVLGSTSALCLGVCLVFKLNPVAGQIANHIVFPLQLALLLPFIRLASRVFGLPAISLSPRGLLLAVHTGPVAFTQQLWRWESRAFLLWMLLSAVLTPMLAFALTPLLGRILRRMQCHQRAITLN
jgi:uncharacterized protein (DUF2062 family)